VALETSTYYALGIPLYGLLMAGEHWLGRRRGQVVYRLADDLGNLACGMGQILMGLFLGPLMLWLYTYGFELRVVSLAELPGGERGPVVWGLSLVLVDLCYYFYHRAGHRLRVLWTVHQVHHQSDGFNFAVALRQPYLSDLYAVFFYFPLPLLGIPLDVFFATVAFSSLNQITLHTRFLPRRSFGIFNTPALHQLHHAKNAIYADANFGAMFIVWDRLFGTYVARDPSEPPVLGIKEGYPTHDSVRAQWLGVERRLWTRRARASEIIPRSDKRAALVLFGLITAAAAVVLVLQQRLPMPVLAAMTVALLFGYRAVGRLLDGRSEVGDEGVAVLADGPGEVTHGLVDALGHGLIVGAGDHGDAKGLPVAHGDLQGE
jgi:sterol desaturase/sphingolipid hydroxylase (fatty acid hydroxylase superfamily)